MDNKICEQLKIMVENLKFLRLNTQKEDGKAFTQQDVADVIGVKYQSYQAYEGYNRNYFQWTYKVHKYSRQYSRYNGDKIRVLILYRAFLFKLIVRKSGAVLKHLSYRKATCYQ